MDVAAEAFLLLTNFRMSIRQRDVSSSADYWGTVLAIGFVLTGLGASSGCSSPKTLVDVKGRIVLNGEPLANAVVMFTPVGRGTASWGFTDENGEYRLRYPGGQLGALPGRHRVSITKAARIDEEPVFPDNVDPDLLSEVERLKARTDKPTQLPARYNTESELIASLDFDTSAVHSFELVDPTD